MNPLTVRSQAFLAGLFFALLQGASSAAGAAEPAAAPSPAVAPPAAELVAEQGGPALVLSYHATPAHRQALQHALAGSVAHQLAQWQAQGAVHDYRLLVNRYVDNGNPDAVLVLGFADAAAEQRWRASTHGSAASGLTPEALAATDEIHTASVERVRGKHAGEPSSKAAWLVIPYRTLVSAAEYERYVDGYVAPQFDGWMKAGVLAHYEVMVSRYPAGRPWNAMVLLEYRDDDALSHREEVLQAVREQLKADSAWKAISESKKSVRTEEEVVIADSLAASAKH